jgi:hypothetical protein
MLATFVRNIGGALLFICVLTSSDGLSVPVLLRQARIILATAVSGLACVALAKAIFATLLQFVLTRDWWLIVLLVFVVSRVVRAVRALRAPQTPNHEL